MAPYATMILAIPAMLIEGAGVMNWLYTHQSIYSSSAIIFSSGILAFCLNFSIFYVIHSTTAVTFNVAGNMKVSYDPKSLPYSLFRLHFDCSAQIVSYAPSLMKYECDLRLHLPC